jgi:uncharacterized membrane protein
MTDLCITVAAYDDLTKAQTDWALVEAAGDANSIYISDAAMLERDPDGRVEKIHRQSHHGWGKGAVVGAVWGLIFPPALIGGAVAGGVGGGVIARLNRSLDRGDLRDLGYAMDAGEVAIVVVTNPESVATLQGLLTNATKTETKVGGSAEDVQRDLDAGK